MILTLLSFVSRTLGERGRERERDKLSVKQEVRHMLFPDFTETQQRHLKCEVLSSPDPV